MRVASSGTARSQPSAAARAASAVQSAKTFASSGCSVSPATIAASSPACTAPPIGSAAPAERRTASAIVPKSARRAVPPPSRNRRRRAAAAAPPPGRGDGCAPPGSCFRRATRSAASRSPASSSPQPGDAGAAAAAASACRARKAPANGAGTPSGQTRRSSAASAAPAANEAQATVAECFRWSAGSRPQAGGWHDSNVIVLTPGGSEALAARRLRCARAALGRGRFCNHIRLESALPVVRSLCPIICLVGHRSKAAPNARSARVSSAGGTPNAAPGVGSRRMREAAAAGIGDIGPGRAARRARRPFEILGSIAGHTSREPAHGPAAAGRRESIFRGCAERA